MTDLRKIIGDRIMTAQKRKYRFGSDVIEELENRYGKKAKAAYYSHRSGRRLPDDDALRAYADVLDVTLEYLRFGYGAAEVERRPVINEDESETSVTPINQHSQEIALRASHKHPVRFIPILSAEQIRDFCAGRGGLATMSGRTLPVPDFLNASPESFAYFIPLNDFSMVDPNGLSYAPGACLVVDPARPIAPGDRVYADVEGFDEPIIRRFVAARAYMPGLKFRLEAFNPAFEPIQDIEVAQIRVLARVIWAAQEQ